jgi:hypothetical protein
MRTRWDIVMGGKAVRLTTDRPIWQGLDIDGLKKLAQKLCKVKNRTRRFGGDQEHVLERGPAGMCGRLIAEALIIISDIVAIEYKSAIPTQKDLANRFKVNAGSYGNFLLGEPSTASHWMTTGYRSLQYLLRGDLPVVDPKQKEAIERIEEYFFANFQSDSVDLPPFFSTGRARYGEPCSPWELAGAIEWTAVQREITRRTAKIIWVAGESAFIRDGVSGVLGTAIRGAVTAGVDTMFVYFGVSSASRSVEEFFSTDGVLQGETLRQVNLANSSLALPARWFEFINPVIQFLYLYVSEEHGDKPDETLYIIRGSSQENNNSVHSRVVPIALEANSTELLAFKRWLKQMESVFSRSNT